MLARRIIDRADHHRRRGQVCVGANVLKQRPAVDRLHIEVKNNQRRSDGLELGQGCAAVLNAMHLVAGRIEVGLIDLLKGQSTRTP